MSEAWNELAARVREMHDLHSALRLLHWDQAVMMPPEGGPGRARAIATVEGEAHRRLTDPRVAELLEAVADDPDLDEPRSASVRVLRRDHEQATKIPVDLVKALAEARGLAYQAWTRARPASDFSMLRPHLERLLSLKIQEADALGWEEARYDALLDTWEPGLRTREAETLFSDLVDGLRPLLERALEARRDPPGFLSGTYDEDKQQEVCRALAERIGFEPGSGRLDRSPHPFTSRIGAGDVRQTTRTHPRNLLGAVYAALHETGHALYEQGLPPEMVDLPAGRVPSLGMHESQSRLWENQVGRSRPFTDFLLPRLKDAFPEELGMTTPEEFFWGVNRVDRSLIRVEADEVTYNLHIALRFELEAAMLRDELGVEDLPGAWNDAMERYVGVRPLDDSDGVLQDMHWSIGAWGYFPTYTIGNLYAAALFRRIEDELGQLDEELRVGDTTRLLGWLRANVHRLGYLYDSAELIQKVIGEPVTAAPLLAYLEEKYSQLYA
jgi:carboxypeptidase Taq